VSSSTPPRPEAKAGARRVRRVNFRALAILAVTAVLGIGGMALAVLLRPAGGSDPLAQARKQIEARRPELALSYLNVALRNDPRDVEALDLKAQLLTESARSRENIAEALKLGDLALRQQDVPEELARKIRRRQVELNLLLGQFVTAQTMARQMLGVDDDDPEAIRRTLRDAEADPKLLRLAGRIEEQLAGTGTPGAAERARVYFEIAHEADPTDVPTAAHLAALALEKRQDPAGGLAILDALAAAAPDSALAHLARLRYLAELAKRAEAVRGEVAGKDARAWYAEADAALARAVERGGSDPQVRLVAADYSLNRDRPEVARAHLDALPEKDRDDPRAHALRGLSYIKENRPDLATDEWRSGLLASHGTDADLTWRMAALQLKRGRLAEARPLVEQYRRLEGFEEPSPAYLYLEGLQQLKQNRPEKAIATLEKARLKAPAGLQAEINFTLGLAYEATRDQQSALGRYDAAILADPNLSAPRLARIRLLQALRPEQAQTELSRALEQIGDDPNLLIAQARGRFREQLQRPAEGRDWSQVDALIARAAEVAPGAADLVRLQADLMIAREGNAKLDEAIALLERATKLQPTDAQLWLARAERLAQAGRVDQALVVLDQAMAPEAAGDQAGLRIARAKLLTARGRGQEARAGLVGDLDRLPADQRPAVWAELGNLYTAQRQPEEARRAYRQWAEMLPNDPLPRLFLLDLALAEGDAEAADAEVQALKTLSGGQGIYWRVARTQELLRSAESGDGDRDARLAEAESLIDEIRKEAPDQRFAPMLRGQLRELRGDKAGAAEAFEEALRLDGGQIALRRLIRLDTELGRAEKLEELRKQYGAEVPSLDRALAEEALRQGDKARAEALGRRVVEVNPEDFDARLWQARLLNTLGKSDEAVAALRQAVARKPEALNPRLALLFFLKGQGKTDEAVAAVEEIIKNVKDLDRPEFAYAQCWRVAGQMDRADAAYEAALKTWPDDARVVRGAADHYESSGRPALAERVLRDALKANPADGTWRWAARALALLRSNHPGDLDAWREARALAEAGDSVEADSPEERLTRGIVLARSAEPKDREQAGAILDQLVLDLPADYPSAAVARAIASQLHIQARDFDGAAEIAAVDARAANATPQAISRYAEILIAAGQYDQADAQIDRLADAANGPADLTAPLLRAKLLLAQEKKAETVQVLRRAFDERTEAPEAQSVGRTLIAALMEVDPAAAEELARKAGELWPATRWMVGVTLARQGKTDDALAFFQEAAGTADPANLAEIGQNTLALVTGEGKATDEARLARAEQVIDALIARKPDDAQLLTLKGYLRHFQQKYDQEVAFYKEALQGRPDDLAFLNNLAWSLSEGLGKPEEALPYIEQAITKTDRPLPQFFDTRGVIYTRLGQLDKAIADLELAARGRPTGPILAHLARAYHKAGRLDDFRKLRDQLRAAKLTPEQLEPTDRTDLVPLLLDGAETAKQP
jgi:tetratricopeptide (TPR) repeat protein